MSLIVDLSTVKAELLKSQICTSLLSAYTCFPTMTNRQMLAVLAQCEMTVDKLDLVKKMNDEETKSYETLHKDINQSIEEGKERIKQYKVHHRILLKI